MKRFKTLISPRGRDGGGGVERFSPMKKKKSPAASAQTEDPWIIQRVVSTSPTTGGMSEETPKATTPYHRSPYAQQTTVPSMISLTAEKADPNSELKQRIKRNSGAGISSPMEEHVRSKKEKRTFNAKLQEMQGNLQHVEQERHSLQRAKEQLEQEKTAIQKELQMREKEVTSLVRRCQMQDEKMREAAQIRCNNNDLTTQVEGLRSSLTMREEEISSIDKLKQKLEDCHQEREELLERLARVKRDHDDVVDTLNDCFKSMQKLQEKQQSNDEDRQRDVQRAELKLEKQRLAYQETICELKAEIQKRHERIEQMETVLRDNMATSTELRRERKRLKESLDEALSVRKESIEKLAIAQEEHQKFVKKIEGEYGTTLDELRTSLTEKDNVIMSLENEVSTGMDKLMKLSEEMDKAQQERSQQQLESKDSTNRNHEAIQALEQENWALREKVSAKDMELTVISSSVSSLEEEKAELLEQLERTGEKVKELEEDNAFIMDMERQLDDVNFSVLETQEENERIQEVYDETVAALRSEFNQKTEMWNELEQGLMEKIVTLEAQNYQLEAQKEAASLEAQQKNDSLDNVVEALQRELNSVKSNLTMTEEKATSQRQDITSLRVELNMGRATLVTKQSALSDLKSEMDQMRRESQAALVCEREKNERVVSDLQNELNSATQAVDEKDADVQRLSVQLEKGNSRFQQEVDTLKSQLDVQEKRVASLTEAVNEERRTKMVTIKEVREEHERSRQEWRDQLGESNVRLQEKRQEVESLQLQLVSLSSTGEKEQIAADLASKVQEEKLDAIQSELDSTQRLAHEKAAEAERFKSELKTTKEHAEDQATAMLERAAELNRKVLVHETELRRAVSACEGKESALATMGTEVEIARRNLADRERTIASLQNEVENLKGTLEQDLSQRDATLTEQVEKAALVSAELEAKRNLVEDLTKEKDGLNDSLRDKETHLSEAKAQVANQGALIKDIRSQLSNEQEQLSVCHARIEELELGLARATAELSKNSKARAGLHDDLSSLQEKLEEREISLKVQEDTVSSLEQQVAHYTTDSESKRNALEELRTELRDARCSFEQEMKSAQTKQAEQQQTISALQSQQHQSTLEKNKLENSFSSLQAELESAHFKFEQESKTLEKQIARKEEMITNLDTELAAVKSTLERGTATLNEELKSQAAKVCALTKAVSKLESELEEKQRDNSSIVAEKENRLLLLERELQSLRETKETSEKQLRVAIQERDEAVVTLKTEAKELHRKAEQDAQSSQTELMALRQQLQKAEIDLAISQDELRDVKMIDLTEAEEAIESLESDLRNLRSKARSDEAVSTTLISDLRAQSEQLEARLSYAEKGSSDTKHLHDKVVSKLQGELDALKQENESLDNELKENFNKLNERHSKITSLTQEKGQLESEQTRLCGQIECLEVECAKAKEEQDKATYALERELNRQFASRQDDDVEFQKRQSDLQKQLKASETKVATLAKQLEEADELLESRTTLLADMVAHNKETEEKQKCTGSQLDELKEESEIFKSDMETAQQELARVKASYAKKEDQLLETIQNERSLREIAEVELENTHAAMKTKRDNRELTELEKENEELRDKVRRQEAYLKRKLQKDKAVRERSKTSGLATPGKPFRERNSRQSGLATPSRKTSLLPTPSTTRGGLAPVSENLFRAGAGLR